MWSFGVGYTSNPTNYVSTDPSYDAYGGGASNYVSTDPTYAPYGQETGGSGLGNMWGGAFSAIGSYADAQSKADASEQQTKLSAQAQLDQLKQQREYANQDKQYKSGAVSKWSKYMA